MNIKNYLLGYKFIEAVAPGKSYSTNIKLQRNLDRTLWVGKISRPLPARIDNFRNTGKPYVRTVDFKDLDDRATLGFRLAKLVGLKSLKTKILPLKRISNLDTVLVPSVTNNVFLSKFCGQSLTKYLESNKFDNLASSDIKNKDEVIRSFVFNLWIGNYDNKDEDYLVDSNNNLISIDYHLLGPGFKSDGNLSLGAWGESFDINQPSDTGWCIGNGKLLFYLRNNTANLSPFEDLINKINSISKLQIKWAMRGLHFYKQGTQENINDLFYNFLLNRRPKLKETIQTWIAADCPITQLPKDNGVQ